MTAASAFSTDLLRNLRAGLRLAFFRRVEPQSFTASVEQLVALVLIDLALDSLSDLAASGLDGRLNFWGLPGALFYLPLLLLAAYIVSRRERDGALALLLPVAVLAARQYLTLAGAVLGLAADAGWLELSERAQSVALDWGPLLWFLLTAGFALLCLTRREPGAKLLHFGIVAALVVAPLGLLPRTAIGLLWTANFDERGDGPQATRSYAVASEDVFYAQPEILRRRLAALRPGRSGVEEIYFVGVAGYAPEDVFRHEVSVVTLLFDQRFGTAGRSIRLINSPGTTLQWPIASVTSLQRTLARIGRLMNLDEDVLFLYLTSHGSDDHRFALEFWPLRLHDLDPSALRGMLDASGIRWRVIVVSACYSGGFVDALKNDSTLVVTAADAHTCPSAAARHRISPTSARPTSTKRCARPTPSPARSRRRAAASSCASAPKAGRLPTRRCTLGRRWRASSKAWRCAGKAVVRDSWPVARDS
jgi:hypothetical protein